MTYISSLSKFTVMMDEPRFAQPIPNVTVAVGRDANLPCVVEHLGTYKVMEFFFHDYSSIFSIFNQKINFLFSFVSLFLFFFVLVDGSVK